MREGQGFISSRSELESSLEDVCSAVHFPFAPSSPGQLIWNWGPLTQTPGKLTYTTWSLQITKLLEPDSLLRSLKVDATWSHPDVRACRLGYGAAHCHLASWICGKPDLHGFLSKLPFTLEA